MPTPDELLHARAIAFLAHAAIGDRVVVRAHDGDGARDALGTLVTRTSIGCTIRTRRGDVDVRLTDVIAAKPVPPAPPRRSPRTDDPDV